MVVLKVHFLYIYDVKNHFCLIWRLLPVCMYFLAPPSGHAIPDDTHPRSFPVRIMGPELRGIGVLGSRILTRAVS